LGLSMLFGTLVWNTMACLCTRLFLACYTNLSNIVERPKKTTETTTSQFTIRHFFETPCRLGRGRPYPGPAPRRRPAAAAAAAGSWRTSAEARPVYSAARHRPRHPLRPSPASPALRLTDRGRRPAVRTEAAAARRVYNRGNGSLKEG